MPFAQRIISSTVLGLLLCTLAVFGIQPVQAAKPPPAGLAISAASWDGTTLSANGTAVNGKDGGGSVTIFDADTTTSLGSVTPSKGGNGSWNYSGTTCADNIYATQDAVTTEPFPVAKGWVL